jgi:ribosomal protein S18 acetylase RimI-like enzyme
MPAEPQVHYFCQPTGELPLGTPVDVVSVQEFLADEPACKALWQLVATQFNTRSKFLAVWPGVRYVAVHRDDDGAVDGLLLLTTPVNWQIDYVVVAPSARGRGVGTALVVAALNEAFRQRVPYVMLTSKESLRPLYEACGFEVVRTVVPV